MATNIDFNIVEQRAIKNEEKIKKFDSRFFNGKNFFGDDDFKNVCLSPEI